MEQRVTTYEIKENEVRIKKILDRLVKIQEKLVKIGERIKEIQDKLARTAYDEGLVDGYIQARQDLEVEERERFRKADEELIEFWVDTIIIAAIGVIIATIISGVSCL